MKQTPRMINIEGGSISEKARQWLYSFHEGKCPICGKATQLNPDYDAKSGELRGLICKNCNVHIGRAERRGSVKMSTSDGVPDTGYGKKLNVNYSILKEILRESNFDEFLRAYQRYPDFVTELDVTKLLYFKGVAESWSDEEIELPNNLMDTRQFNDCRGKISGSIVKEIKRGDPRNLEYEAVQESMLDMNDLTASVTEKVMASDQFMKKVQE